MPHPAPGWISTLPYHRLMGEFSMWSADLTNLAADTGRIGPFADMLHIDVADGHFAPALLFFPDLVAKIRQLTAVPIHIHLMCMDAVLLSQIAQFAESGADLISIHVENAAVADEALSLIRAKGLGAGMVLRVETPVSQVERWLKRLDCLTLLGTSIGVKGQALNPAAPARLGEAAALIKGTSQKILLAADGGIRENTVPVLRAAGAQTVVLGSLAFGAIDLGERMRWLHAL